MSSGWSNYSVGNAYNVRSGNVSIEDHAILFCTYAGHVRRSQSFNAWHRIQQHGLLGLQNFHNDEQMEEK